MLHVVLQITLLTLDFMLRTWSNGFQRMIVKMHSLCILFLFFFFYLQSDVIHQSVYELVHSEDREELQRQLGWDSFLGAEDAGISLQELLSSDHHHLLDRSFTVRFRCLLDNTSGFLVRLDCFH